MADIRTITPSPAQLKALSHPVRLRMLGLLRFDGPATATTLAQRLGLNTGATSYHLRSLHQHGFIVEDEERGNGRDRWWRAVHQTMRTGADTDSTPEGREAVDALVQSLAVVHTEMLQRSIEDAPTLPAEWREASMISDTNLCVTAEQAKELTDTLTELLIKWRSEYSEDKPNFIIQVHGFPRPGTVGMVGDE